MQGQQHDVLDIFSPFLLNESWTILASANSYNHRQQVVPRILDSIIVCASLAVRTVPLKGCYSINAFIDCIRQHYHRAQDGHHHCFFSILL